MTKNIIKEIIIVLLLILAIILVLGVLLYEYVPTNKIIPEQVSYTTPENVKTELATDTNIDDTEVVMTYEIDSTDLKNYKKVQGYVSGKKNPFEALESENTTTGNTTTSQNTSNASGSSTNNSNTNTQSQSTETTQNQTGYLPDKGTK